MPISYDATLQPRILPATSVFLNPPRNQAISRRRAGWGEATNPKHRLMVRQTLASAESPRGKTRDKSNKEAQASRKWAKF